MKIAFIIDNVSNTGGTERVLKNLSDLFSHENNITIYSLDKGRDTGYFNDDETNIVYARGGGKLQKILYVSRSIKLGDFDKVIIISMGKLSCIMNPVLKLVNISGDVLSCDHVGIESFNYPIRILKFISYIFADKIITLTDNDKNILKKIPFLNNKAYTIRNSSSFNNYNTNYKDLMGKKKNIVLAVGRLTPQKNFEDLINIWSKVPLYIRNNWSLRIAGTGEQYNTLKNKIKHLELDNSIEILGNIENIQDEYEKASILCMTSIYEGLPMVLIEAKNFAIPAISYKCKTGPSEIISNDGYLIENFNSDDFLQKLVFLINNDNVRKNLAFNSFCNKKSFSNEIIAESWSEVLK